MPSMVTVPTWTNGSAPTSTPFTTLATDVDTLCQLTTGFPASAGRSGRPSVKAELINAQAVATATLTMVLWDIATNQNDNMYNAQANQNLIIQTAGWYRIEAQIAYDSGAAGLRICRFYVNGTADPGNGTAAAEEQMGSPSPQTSRVQAVTVEHLAANATVAVGVYQDTGGSLNLRQNTSYGTWITATWIAPY